MLTDGISLMSSLMSLADSQLAAQSFDCRPLAPGAHAKGCGLLVPVAVLGLNSIHTSLRLDHSSVVPNHVSAD